MNSGYGDSIEDYEVLGMLGKGGFAQVFRAISKNNGQEVAIKRIDRKRMQEKNMTSRVKNEIKVHVQLKHPLVLDFYNCFEDDKYVYLVIELCHNGDLKKFIETKKKLKEAEARKVFRQVVEGLLYLHSHMILHRDLSLSNILLTKTMDAKIGDFGLSIQLKAEDEKHYTFCGTFNYMAPEVKTKDPHGHGLESDVWSLGCMLYAMMVGKTLSEDDASRGLKLPSELSPEAQDILSSMLIKHPAGRLKVSQILCHPFMTMQPRTQQQETHLFQQRHGSSARGFVPASLTSLDSGHGTHCTTSSNNTTSGTHGTQSGTHGPMRATMIPRGVPQQHATPSFGSDRNANSSPSTRSNSRAQQAHPLSSERQPEPEFLYRRSKSMDVLAAGMGEGGGEAWSYHSQPQLATWQRNCELEREKENPPVPKPAVPVDVQHRRARRPFQDNTNRNRQTGTVLTAPLKKPAADEVHGNSSGSKQQQQQRNSLKELVPPLNVARLAPVQQELRNGVLCISKANKVWHKHYSRGGSSRQHGELRTGNGLPPSTNSVEILQVSANGMEVEIFRPLHSSSRSQQHSASPEHDGFYLHACYTYHDLPSRYWKKYQYVSEFVSMVRSKTPKVTLFTDQAKCMLMENGPNPDYQVCFYNGAKVQHQLASSEWHFECGGSKYSLSEGADGMLAELPEACVTSLHKHGQESLHKCRDIEMAMTGLETQGSSLEMQSSGTTCFPIVAGRKHKIGGQRHRSNSSSSNSKGGGSQKRDSLDSSWSHELESARSSLSNLCAASSCTPSMLQFPDGMKMPSYPGTPVESSFQSAHLGSGRGSGGGSNSNVQALGPESGRDRAKERSQPPRAESVIRSVEVTGTCKAVQYGSGVVALWYDDGSQLELQSSASAAFKYTDPQGREIMFGKNDKVPDDIKPKLIPLPKVINYFISQSK